MLGRLVEQSQERVEGHNFDIRKHLLEYDDVLNDQRERIYKERDSVLIKQDLEEDVLAMLRSELQKRIPEALADEEGPWKLLAFLEEIQPTIYYPQFGQNLPSYTMALVAKVLSSLIPNPADPADVENGLTELARQALQAENRHVRAQTGAFIQRTADSFTQQVNERLELLDIFLENNLELFQQNTREFFDQLQTQVHLRINLDSNTLAALKTAPHDLPKVLRDIVESVLLKNVLSRLAMTIERRLNSRLAVNVDGLAELDWVSIEDRILEAVDLNFQERINQLEQPGQPNPAEYRQLDSQTKRICGNSRRLRDGRCHFDGHADGHRCPHPPARQPARQSAELHLPGRPPDRKRRPAGYIRGDPGAPGRYSVEDANRLGQDGTPKGS
jgi:Preprotein translocase subunit SecA (ATPase, RNA helicase)